MPVVARTQWKRVAILIGAGCVGAAQIGKAAIAIPLLRQDLGLDLSAAAWVLGIYSALGAVSGLAAGLGVSLVGARNAAFGGLLAIAAGSLAGGMTQHFGLLLASRALEGCGFLAMTIAVPILMRSVTAAPDRPLSLVLWSVYVPSGMAAIMLLGPFVLPLGWPFLWLVNGAVAALYALLLFAAVPADRRDNAATQRGLLSHVGEVLRAPGPMLLAGIFVLYTFQYTAMAGLMPTLLVERLGLTLSQAGLISALAVIANGFGNLSAGLVMRLGIPTWLTIAVVYCVIAAASFGVFSDALPVAAVALIACLSLAVSGVIPGLIFGTTPKLARTPVIAALTLGLIVQASNIGQWLGPSTLGAFATHFGWTYAPALFVTLGAAGFALALGLRLVLRHSE